MDDDRRDRADGSQNTGGAGPDNAGTGRSGTGRGPGAARRATPAGGPPSRGRALEFRAPEFPAAALHGPAAHTTEAGQDHPDDPQDQPDDQRDQPTDSRSAPEPDRTAAPASPAPASPAPARKAPAKQATARKTAAKKAPARRARESTAAPAEKTAAPAKKAARAKKAVPAPAAGSATAAPAGGAAREPITTGPEKTPDTVPVPAWAWERIKARPGYAPEVLALAAVARLGPQARDWADQVRRTYPAARPDGLARLAVRHFTRLAALGAAGVAAVTVNGPPGLAAELGALGWIQARLVLHLAAAYGRQPTDVARAVDLLVLTRVHPSVETAQAALAAVAAAGTTGSVVPVGARHVLEETVWRLPNLSARAGGWQVRRLAARLLPGARLLVAVSDATASTELLAARAVTHYRRRGDRG